MKGEETREVVSSVLGSQKREASKRRKLIGFQAQAKKRAMGVLTPENRRARSLTEPIKHDGAPEDRGEKAVDPEGIPGVILQGEVGSCVTDVNVPKDRGAQSGFDAKHEVTESGSRMWKSPILYCSATR